MKQIEKYNGSYYSRLGLYRGYMKRMENKMEATIAYWGSIGVEPETLCTRPPGTRQYNTFRRAGQPAGSITV